MLFDNPFDDRKPRSDEKNCSIELKDLDESHTGEYSHFAMENCLGFVGKKTDKVELGKKDFDKLGEDAGDFLRKIGAEKVTVKGSRVEIDLKDIHIENVDMDGVNRIKFSKKISADITRDKDSITVKNLKGVQVEFLSRATPWVSLPDVELRSGKVKVITAIKDVTVEADKTIYNQAVEAFDAIAKLRKGK